MWCTHWLAVMLEHSKPKLRRFLVEVTNFTKSARNRARRQHGQREVHSTANESRESHAQEDGEAQSKQGEFTRSLAHVGVLRPFCAAERDPSARRDTNLVTHCRAGPRSSFDRFRLAIPIPACSSLHTKYLPLLF